MQSYPSYLLENAVNQLAKLPGIGRKSALRLALFLLKQDKEMVDDFAKALMMLKSEVKYCECCKNISDSDICSICSDDKRDSSTICVVETIKELMLVEQTGQYRGLYHVLHGVLSPLNHVYQDDIRIKELLQRVAQGDIREVIMATNPDTEGEATAMYISRLLRPMEVTVTRLAYGIPVGGDIEYADEVTLLRAMEGRKRLD